MTGSKDLSKIPQVGDPFYPEYESDIYPPLPPHVLTIKRVEGEREIGGWNIQASDNTWYDCYWSKKWSAWVYSLD